MRTCGDCSKSEHPIQPREDPDKENPSIPRQKSEVVGQDGGTENLQPGRNQLSLSNGTVRIKEQWANHRSPMNRKSAEQQRGKYDPRRSCGKAKIKRSRSICVTTGEIQTLRWVIVKETSE